MSNGNGNGNGHGRGFGRGDNFRELLNDPNSPDNSPA